MTEDEIYRTSTQYRLWSFTPESLASLRSTTNATAADGVKAAIRALDAAKAESNLAENGGKDGAPASERGEIREVDCLTVEEEQKLVGFYCMKTIEFADFCEFPTNVKVSSRSPFCLSCGRLMNAYSARQQQSNSSNDSTFPTRP